MKVLHVVTLVSPDGAYGGPLRVAVNLAAALRAEGHEAVVAAGARGWDELPTRMDGVPLRLFRAAQAPGLGHAGLISPGLTGWLLRNARRFDVVHLHFARDLVAVPAALAVGAGSVPLVLQTHGMIDAPSNRLARLLDALVVRRALRSAHRVAWMSEIDRKGLLEVGGPDIALVHLGNGVPIALTPAAPETSHEVLFLSRLHRRKRPTVFVEAAALVHRDRPEVRFALVGPDGGEADAVRQRITELGADEYVRYEGALAPEETGARLRRAAVLVLPSIDEIFPMAALEAMANGIPIVLGRSSAFAGRVTETGAGMVVDDDARAYASAVDRLMTDVDKRRRSGAAAYGLANDDFSMAAAAREALRIYRSAIEMRRR